MPNWITNRLTIQGDPSKVSEVAHSIKAHNYPVDFNKIIPRPEILNNTATGMTTINGRTVTDWYVDNSIEDREQRKATERLFTPSEEAQLTALGFRNWHDWSCQHWGTKWNACEATVAIQSDGYLEIRFDTAWTAPEPILAALRQKFPDLEINLWHEDEA